MRDLSKACPMTVKATADGEAPGTFEAVVAVFGNVDSDGEVVAPGAFTATLAKGPKPITFSHDWTSVPIGQTLEAKQTDEGLLIKGRLFVGPGEDHVRAREVYAAMRGGALNEFSFGGKVIKESTTLVDGKQVTSLDEIDLVEYGPCLKGANPATRLVAVKSLLADHIVSPTEARAALGLKAEEAPADDVPPEEPASEVEPDDKPDDDEPETPPEADLTPDWSQTLAAVRAGVLSTAEARERLGLPAVEVEPDEPDPDDAGSAEVAELLL